jgi:hypothetical protein
MRQKTPSVALLRCRNIMHIRTDGPNQAILGGLYNSSAVFHNLATVTEV